MIINEELIRKKLLDSFSENHIDVEGTIERSFFNEEKIELRRAAVLIPLVFEEQNWSLVFTRRTELVDSHKGQVAFPGGGSDDNEDQPEQTALREAWEEIGIKADDVRLLGRMNSVITITNFSVTPVVGVISWRDHFNLSQKEVSRVFKIPLDWLIKSSNWEKQKFVVEGLQEEHTVIKYLPYDGEILWGATARITHNFLNILELI